MNNFYYIKKMDEYFKSVLKEAQEAGMKALRECVPTPVRWQQSDLFNKPIGQPGEIDNEGECGGAYITGLDGKSEFVRWAKKADLKELSKGVYKGYDLRINHEDYHGQSYERYKACAEAYATVLKKHGIKCSVKAYLT